MVIQVYIWSQIKTKPLHCNVYIKNTSKQYIYMDSENVLHFFVDSENVSSIWHLRMVDQKYEQLSTQ